MLGRKNYVQQVTQKYKDKDQFWQRPCGLRFVRLDINRNYYSKIKDKDHLAINLCNVSELPHNQ